MEYARYDMNAYNLHIIKTNKFKTITVEVSFRRKVSKDEITIRNLLKEIMVNVSFSYPTEKSLIIETEKLYDLKLMSSNYRVGNYAILSFRARFLNEKYTEEGMNEESIRFLLDLIFNPKLDSEVDKCKKKIEKGILSLKDNKVKYALLKLLESTKDRPYSNNSYGSIEELNKITVDELNNYYNGVIKNDIVDVFVVGDVSDVKIKNIFKEYFKATTFHKQECDVVVKELPIVRKVEQISEQDDVNQTQMAILCGLNKITDRERKFVLPVFNEMLGGSSNSILFNEVREKNSYAYYVNSIVKSYDNIMMIYSGIDGNNQDNVRKIIEKSLKSISKGNIDKEKFECAKETMKSAIRASLDNPIGIINNYYAMELVNSPEVNQKIKEIDNVIVNDIINVSKKITINKIFVLEASSEENND